MTIKRSTYYFTLIILSFFVSSCEKENEGLLDQTLYSPFIRSVTTIHSELHLDTNTTSSVTLLPNGKYRITDSLFAQVINANGIPDVKQVFFRIYRPGASNHFASGVLMLQAGINLTTASYSGAFSFVIDRTEAGLYKIEVYAQNFANNTSNIIQVPLTIARNNSVPFGLSAVVPDTVFLPPGDSLLIRMTATVNDSDGVADIEEVFFLSLNSSDPTRKFLLLDDGGANGVSGDALPGDGEFTITVKLVDGPTVRRTFEFEFHAVDRQGSESATLLKLLTVE